jgi:hypothetical protein
MTAVQNRSAAPPWRDGGPLVVCVDGPRARGWYFRDWWIAVCRQSAVDGARPGDPDALLLNYVPTGTTHRHPVYAVDGFGLRWNPARAVELGWWQS